MTKEIKIKLSIHFLSKILILIVVSVLLIGCVKSANTAQINMQAAQYLNPDVGGRASPLVVTIYQLKKPFSFKQASFSALENNSAQVLGNDIIDKQTVEIRPGQKQTITESLAQNTHYIGIIAAYRNIDQAAWRKVIKVKPKENATIKLDLESQGLMARLLKEHHGFRI